MSKRKRPQTGMSAPPRPQTGMSAPPRKAGTVEIGPAPGISDVTSVGDGERVVRLDGPPPWTVTGAEWLWLLRHRPGWFVTAAEWRRHQAALAKGEGD